MIRTTFCAQCFTYDQSAVHLCALHAAAPALLAALQFAESALFYAKNNMESARNWDKMAVNDAWTKARAAIALAKDGAK